MPTLHVMLCNANISKIFEYSKRAANNLSPASQQPLQRSGSNTQKDTTKRQMKIKK